MTIDARLDAPESIPRNSEFAPSQQLRSVAHLSNKDKASRRAQGNKTLHTSVRLLAPLSSRKCRRKCLTSSLHTTCRWSDTFAKPAYNRNLDCKFCNPTPTFQQVPAAHQR